MSAINKLHKNNIPKQWFFFDPLNNYNLQYFNKSNPRAGVIFFSKSDRYDEKFFYKIEPLARFCVANRIKFLMPPSISWAFRLKPFGLITDKKMCLSTKLHLQFLKKKYFLATKVHNKIEAIESSNFNLIFVSPVFPTRSFPKKKHLGKLHFYSICKMLDKKIVFALGGVDNSNYKYLKNDYLFGFGGINNFIEPK